ncbi:LOW QUALITY PROTEIN: E3 ubiquitin-protein ligase TRIM38-like [Erethizon dorsatum]
MASSSAGAVRRDHSTKGTPRCWWRTCAGATRLHNLLKGTSVLTPTQHMERSLDSVELLIPEKLEKAARNLSPLQEECMNQKVFITTQITTWKDKIEIWRQKLKSDFKNLHTILHEEEKLYVWRLEEEKQMLRRLRESEANLQQKSEELKSHILELEDVKGTLSRTCAVKLETPEVFSLEIQAVCDVSELYLDVKKILRPYEVNVTQDPDTAHPALILSEDRREVSRGCSQQNLKFSSRFTAFPCVLGCEGFTSGRHYFEMDVGGTGWDGGVCMENVGGLGMKQEPELGFWVIRLCTEDGYVALSSPQTVLELREWTLVVGVVLDYEAGAVSFYNMTAGAHVFTFPKASFSDTLWPFFQVYEPSPLPLLPHVVWGKLRQKQSFWRQIYGSTYCSSFTFELPRLQEVAALRGSAAERNLQPVEANSSQLLIHRLRKGDLIPVEILVALLHL